MAGEDELVLGRDAIVASSVSDRPAADKPSAAKSVAERVRARAAAILDQGFEPYQRPAAGHAAAAAGIPLDEDAAARRRVAMFLAVAAPLLFVAAIIASAALVGEPKVAPPRAEPVAASSPAAAPVAVSVAPAAALAAPAGSTLAALSLDGDRVAAHFTKPDGDEIVVYDFRTGVVAARIAVARAAAPVSSALLLTTPDGPQPGAAPPAPSIKPGAQD